MAQSALTLLSSSLPLSLLFPGRATATHRGQILFKDALAQQLCEQGGEWRHSQPACTRSMFPMGHLYVHPHLPPLTSHYCPSCAPECQHADELPPLRRPLVLSPSPLSNEAATARDSWMSYIASLIPAYAKRSFTQPSSLSSPPLSLALAEICASWMTLLTSTFFFFPGLRQRFERLPPDAAFVLGVCNCLFTGRTPPPLPSHSSPFVKFDFKSQKWASGTNCWPNCLR